MTRHISPAARIAAAAVTASLLLAGCGHKDAPARQMTGAVMTLTPQLCLGAVGTAASGECFRATAEQRKNLHLGDCVTVGYHETKPLYTAESITNEPTASCPAT